MLLAAALGVGEVFTLSFLLGPLALAAALAGVMALLGVGIAFQLVVFILAAVGSLALIRPIARRHLRTPPSARTGTAALVGSTATVVERVDANGGMVRLGGEIWTARPYDDSQVIEPGARVEVLQIRGATALVSE
jgi:membrane protein implicated in regulation of membrane protease activity